MPDGKEYFFSLIDGVYKAHNNLSTIKENIDGTFTLTTEDDLDYTFNAAGYLSSISDKYANTLNLTLDANGNVQTITDTAGRTYTLVLCNI